MNITNKTFEWNGGYEPRDVEAEAYLSYKLDGESYDHGELEALRAGVDNAHKVIARLVHILLDKDILSKGEVEKLVEGIY